MAQSSNILGQPDDSGLIFLQKHNGVLQALSSHHCGASEPPTKIQCMTWFDLSTFTLKIRDPQNLNWHLLSKYENGVLVPCWGGVPITRIATLAPSVDGYVRYVSGVPTVEDISTPDIPIFGVSRPGMVPGPSAVASDSRYRLCADGQWRAGLVTVAQRNFGGNKDYGTNVPPASYYKLTIRAKLSGTQPLLLQIGNSGSPKQTGYLSRATRAELFITQGKSGLASNEVYNIEGWTTDRGFLLWRQYGGAPEFLMTADLVSHGQNKWTLVGTGGHLGPGQPSDSDSSFGEVSLSGTLDYIRVIAAGSPFGTFNNQHSIDSGSLVVLA